MKKAIIRRIPAMKALSARYVTGSLLRKMPVADIEITVRTVFQVCTLTSSLATALLTAAG